MHAWTNGHAAVTEEPTLPRAASRRMSKEASEGTTREQGFKGARVEGKALREQGVEDGQETKAGMDHVLHAPSLMAPSSWLSSSPLSLSLLHTPFLLPSLLIAS